VTPPIVTEPDRIAENSRATPIEDAPRRPNIAESRSVQGATVAGGAGVAASNIGRENAEELDELESTIEQGGSVSIEPETAPAPDPGVAGEDAEKTEGAETAAPETGERDVRITDGLRETIDVGGDRPARHEKHAADAQILFALQILIVIAVAYIIFARLDDWFRYRR